MPPKKDDFYNRKVKLLGMLSKVPEDKLDELEEFMINLIKKEGHHGYDIHKRQDVLDSILQKR